MSKEVLKGLIDLVPEENIDTIYKFIIKFIPEVEPEEDEIIAIKEARTDEESLVSHDEINWE